MVGEIQVKSILNKHKKGDSSKYGENMAKMLSVKINAPAVLEKQFKRRAKKGEYGIIPISTSAKPYQKIEEKYKLTRKLLEIILKYRFSVHVLTKSKLVLRYLDLLKEIVKEANPWLCSGLRIPAKL